MLSAPSPRKKYLGRTNYSKKTRLLVIYRCNIKTFIASTKLFDQHQTDKDFQLQAHSHTTCKKLNAIPEHNEGKKKTGNHEDFNQENYI